MAKIEGYWKTFDSDEYPNPVPNVLSKAEAIEIYIKIVEKQEEAEIKRYRGLSHSRITGERLGNVEYETNEWIWPGDFAKHYVLENRVKPSDEFLKYIGYV